MKQIHKPQARAGRWPRSLFLFLLFASMTLQSWAVGNTFWPYIDNCRNASVDIAGNLEYSFDWLIFNYDGDNSYYNRSNPPKLYINDVEIGNLDQVYDANKTLTCQNEDVFKDMRGGHGHSASKIFNTTNYGKVQVYMQPVTGTANKNIWMEVRVVMQRFYPGVDLTFKITGGWTSQGSFKGSQSVTWKPNTPTASLPSTAGKFTHNADRSVKYEQSEGTLRAVNSNSSDWAYRFRMCSEKPAGKTSYVSSTYASLTAPENATSYTGSFTIPSNHKPTTIYPAIEHYSVKNLWWGNPVAFVKNYDAVTIPGYVAPTNISVTNDFWNNRLTVTWDEEKLTGNQTTGNWMVFRTQDNGTTWERASGKISYAKRDYNDSDCSKNVSYKYAVVFVPNAFNLGEEDVNAPTDIQDLYVVTDEAIALTNGLAINSLSAQQDPINNWFNLTWTLSTTFPTSATRTFHVFRSKNNGTWTEAGTATIASNTQTTMTYTDKDVASAGACDFFRYKVTFDLNGETIENEDQTMYSLSSNKVAGVYALSCSKGSYSNMVKCSWQANVKGNSSITYELKRRTLGSDDNFTTIYTTSSTEESFSYDDESVNPGDYYQYVVESSSTCEIYDEDEDKTTTFAMSQTATDDGFSIAYGVVSGRISYDGGTAVEGVTVTLEPESSSGLDKVKSYSMQFNSTADAPACIAMPMKEGDGRALFVGRPWTIQLNAKVESGNQIPLVASGFNIALYLEKRSESWYLMGAYPTADNQLSYNTSNLCVNLTNAGLNPATYLNYVLSYDGDMTYTVTVMDKSNHLYQQSFTAEKTAHYNGDYSLCFGNLSETGDEYPWTGKIDEVRVYSGRVIGNDELKKTNFTPLTGSEDNLCLYWPMNEGVKNQATVYDNSFNGSRTNGRHGKIYGVVAPSDDVPFVESKVGFSGTTNKDGSFVIRRLPFNGEGTNYIVRPTLGVHKFNPTYSTRYMSANSLVHSAVDFKDESSFPVTGTVYYEGTSYPVEDAYVYVDGQLASSNGQAVKTNAFGEYSVDVPIGKHSISVKKDNHTFVNEGRFPEDPQNVGTTYTFEREMSNLTFWDNTLVPVYGRVTGGEIEQGKAIGLGLSKANIGQAQITLTYDGDQEYSLNADVKDGEYTPTYKTDAEDVRSFDVATTNTNSQTTIAAGNLDASRTITVMTDPVTGEWSAMLPPLLYKVTGITLLHNTDNISFANSLNTIDARYPSKLTTSKDEEVGDSIQYCAADIISYRTPSPVLQVTQRYQPGFFGSASVTAEDAQGKEAVVSTINTTTVEGEEVFTSYRFGYPVFQQYTDYEFDIYGYEAYTNYDGEQPVVDKVPLQNAPVRITNPMSTKATVVCTAGNSTYQPGDIYEVETDELSLGEDGHIYYKFSAGLPNIQGEHLRTMSIAYDANGQEKTWTGNETFNGTGIVLGLLASGNNFVTSGPDEVTMILRDPAGSESFATWEKGSSSTKKVSQEFHLKSETELTAELSTGQEVMVATGVGVAKIEKMEQTFEDTYGLKITLQTNEDKSWTSTTTNTLGYSTSPKTDYVGAVGDVFIGTASNLIFGAASNVRLQQDGDGVWSVGMADVMTTGQKFTTAFAYDQNYIENVLIPNFESLRDNLLSQYPVGSDVVAGDETRYVSKLSDKDPRYATSNSDKEVWGDAAVSTTALDKTAGRIVGPSYTMILPREWRDDGVQDMVNYYNTQIKHWRNEMAKNEQAKYKAINNRDDFLRANRSFSSGATITETMSSESANEWNVTEELVHDIIIGTKIGGKINGMGAAATIKEDVMQQHIVGGGGGGSDTEAFSYTLQEDGDDDYLSIDVFDAPDGFGPIFYTRAGATTCPYEDEVVTKYYKPGFVIQEKTVQIEKPELAINEESSVYATGVPSGKKAKYLVDFINNSETGESLWFDVSVVDTSNPDGAAVYMDDVSLNYGRTIYLPAGITTKSIYIEQSDEDILSYPGIKLKLASQCQKDDSAIFPEIASYLTLNAEFTAAGSPIELAASSLLVNSNNENALTLSMYGYDINSKTLDRVAIQMYDATNNQWKNLQQYAKAGDSRINGTTFLTLPVLSGADRLDYIIDLHESIYIDQSYVFRAVTVSNINGQEVLNPSDEIAIMRDIHGPQLIANPSPSNGILTADGEVSITFNEDIRSNLLNKSNNFVVKGILNESKIDHESTLALPSGAGTRTDATIDLSNRSFAFNFWLKNTSAGQILSQGTGDDNFSLSINANNKLVVTIGGETYTSTASVPANMWNFFSVSYDASEETPQLNIDCMNDANEIELFHNQDVAEYSGNGPVTIGADGQLNGQFHELTLWNEARTKSEAQSGMYTTKNVYTPSLIGYWQLNEGHGTMGTDLSRNRHMTLPGSGSWYMNNVNYGMDLSGSTLGNIVVSTAQTDDYMIETWFRAQETQPATVASILSINENALDIRLNAGNLELVANGQTYAVTTEPMNDNNWHHIAFNVLKSTNGSAILYVDGKAKRQLNASEVPSCSGNLHLGGHRYLDANGLYKYNQFLKGAVDELRVWKGRRSVDAITDNMYRRVTDDEPGLVAYYPMEKTTRDAITLQESTSFSIDDRTGNNENGLAVLTGESGQKQKTFTSYFNTNSPALKSAPAWESVAYNFVASERKVLINLDADPVRIEGCTLQFTVRDVRDANSNFCAPITWTAYVQQNQLKWTENEIAVRKNGENAQTFTAIIENNSGTAESWTISGLPSWLTVNTESGNLAALGKKTLNFTVSPAAPIGKYEEIIYLTGNTGIAEPLYLNLVSMGDVPEWSVDPAAYENSIAIVGQLSINGTYSSDTEDIVAAFQGGECVGVAHPKYIRKYDSYFLSMTVYSNEVTATQPLAFKVYDASTGITYPVVNISGGSPAVTSITFNGDDLIGSFKAPILFTPSQSIEQETALKSGWTWLSLYVTPEDNSLRSIFKYSEFANYVKTKDPFASKSDGEWYGALTTIEPGKLYKVNSTAPGSVTITGEPANATKISLAKGWNWIGYTSQSTMSLSDAFGNASPVDEDVVKGQNGFAIYTDGEWFGSLESMTPGLGYAYKSGAATTKQFTYPKLTSSSAKAAPRKIKTEQYVNADYSGNMTMIAVVMKGDEVVAESEVAVVRDNELRGLSTTTIEVPCEAGTQPEHFITIAGDNNGDVLNFIVTVDGFDYTLKQTELYQNDAMFGTVKVPYVLQLGDATDIHAISDDANGSIYDLAGRRLPATKQRGVYIHNGVKVVK